jgi:acetolactate synthase-1/2/3 large subunit
MTTSLEIEKPFPEPSRTYPEASDLIVDYLEQIGVDHVFGVPGGAIEPFYNALARSGHRGRIKTVVARHEAGAAFMADGYARETGRLGVCCTTTGPGATNAITGVACAYQDEVPMLVITAQTPLDRFGRGAVQESSCTAIDTVAMLRHCTHYNTLVSHPKQLEHKLVAAITMAFHARGPVHLSIPLDILRARLGRDDLHGEILSLASLIHEPKLADFERIADLTNRIRAARHMIIVVGEGCARASTAVIELAEFCGALLVTTPQAKGLIDSYHPHYRGVCGLAGHRTAFELLRHSATDLVVIAGSSLDEQATQGWLRDEDLRGKLIHVDSLARHFLRSAVADLHVCGNIETIFQHVLARMPDAGAAKRPPWDADQAVRQRSKVIPFERRVRDRRAANAPVRAEERRQADRRTLAAPLPIARHFSLTDETRCHSNASPIKPQRLMYELSRLFPPRTRFLADIGNSFLWGLHYLHPHHPDRREEGSRPLSYFRTSMGFASMGWAIGASIGTALGNPRDPVVCIVGDGSYLMSGQEITTAISFGLPVIFVVLNDQALGTVKHGQQLARAESIGYDLPPISYAGVARSMGVESYTVISPQDLQRIDITCLCKRRGPTLIDVHVDRNEVPPLAERMDMLLMA